MKVRIYTYTHTHIYKCTGTFLALLFTNLTNCIKNILNFIFKKAIAKTRKRPGAQPENIKKDQQVWETLPIP